MTESIGQSVELSTRSSTPSFVSGTDQAVGITESIVPSGTDNTRPSTPSSVVMKADPGIDTTEVSRFIGMVFGKTTDSYVQLCPFTVEGGNKPRPAFFKMGGELTDGKGETYTATPDKVAELVAQGDRDGILSPDRRSSQMETVNGWYIRMTTLSALPANKHERGGARLTRQVIGFWADGDYGDKGHKRKPGALPNPPDADGVRAVWKAAGYPEPSVTWMTGGGIDGLWMFPEPITLPEPGSDEFEEAYTRISKASARWGARLQRTARTMDWNHDTGNNLDRVLRLPGSVNRKADHAMDPKAVYAEYSGATYTLDELMSLCPAPIEHSDGSRTDALTGEQISAPRAVKAYDGPTGGETPWEAYNAYMWAEGRFRQQIAEDGWKHHSQNGVENLTHPAKDPSEGQSATFGHNEDPAQPKLYVFSSNAPGLLGVSKEEGGCLEQYVDPYTYLAATVFAYDGSGVMKPLKGEGGALSACAKHLKARGYGSKLSTQAAEREPMTEEEIIQRYTQEMERTGSYDDDPRMPLDLDGDGQGRMTQQMINSADYTGLGSGAGNVVAGYDALTIELEKRQAIIDANRVEAERAEKDPGHTPSWEIKAYEGILGREQAQKRRADELRVEEPEDDYGDLFDELTADDAPDARPTFGVLNDDDCGLFYAGTTNCYFGESGIGKTLIQSRNQVEAMRNGGNVVHWECDNNGNKMIIRRLIQAGATREMVANQIRFFRSDGEMADHRNAHPEFHADVTLVTLDALTPAISALGGEVNHPSGTDIVIRTLMAPYTVNGATGIFIGHVGHENKDRQAGSARMFAAVQGAVYQAAVISQPTKGGKGLVSLKLAKDNQGEAGEVGQRSAYVTYDSTAGDGSLNVFFSRERDAREVAEEMQLVEAEKMENATQIEERQIRTIWKLIFENSDAMSVNDIYVKIKDTGGTLTARQVRTRMDKMLTRRFILVDEVASELPAATDGGKPCKRYKAVASPEMMSDAE